MTLLERGQTDEQTNRQTYTETQLNALPPPAAIQPAWDNKVKKVNLRNQNMFAGATHIVAQPHAFAFVVTPPT